MRILANSIQTPIIYDVQSVTFQYLLLYVDNVIAGSLVTLVVSFGSLPQNFGRWWGPTNDGFAHKLMQLEWQRHSTPTCC